MQKLDFLQNANSHRHSREESPNVLTLLDLPRVANGPEGVVGRPDQGDQSSRENDRSEIRCSESVEQPPHQQWKTNRQNPEGDPRGRTIKPERFGETPPRATQVSRDRRERSRTHTIKPDGAAAQTNALNRSANSVILSLSAMFSSGIAISDCEAVGQTCKGLYFWAIGHIVSPDWREG